MSPKIIKGERHRSDGLEAGGGLRGCGCGSGGSREIPEVKVKRLGHGHLEPLGDGPAPGPVDHRLKAHLDTSGGQVPVEIRGRVQGEARHDV